MPGAVKTVEAQIHVKSHSLVSSASVSGVGDPSFVAAPPKEEKSKGGRDKEKNADKD